MKKVFRMLPVLAVLAMVCVIGFASTAMAGEYDKNVIYSADAYSITIPNEMSGKGTVTLTADKPFSDMSAWVAGQTRTFKVSFSDPAEAVDATQESRIGNGNSDDKTFVDTNTVTLKLEQAGWQKVEIYGKKAFPFSYYTTGAFYVFPKTPNLNITTYYNGISVSGDTKNNFISGDKFMVKMPDGTPYGDLDIIKGGKIPAKANTSYTINWKSYASADDLADGSHYFGAEKSKTVKTGPSTKPVIKSVKVSNAKCVKTSKYTYVNGVKKYYYKTTWTVKVTLSKKASGIKGVVISDNGGFHDYKVKGTGTTFTTTMGIESISKYAGNGRKLTVTTYSNSEYGAYSPTSKSKSYKIKNGTY